MAAIDCGLISPGMERKEKGKREEEDEELRKDPNGATVSVD